MLRIWRGLLGRPPDGKRGHGNRETPHRRRYWRDGAGQRRHGLPDAPTGPEREKRPRSEAHTFRSSTRRHHPRGRAGVKPPPVEEFARHVSAETTASVRAASVIKTAGRVAALAEAFDDPQSATNRA